MSQYNNSAKIFTGSTGGELRISLNNKKQTVYATNNKAQYYAELAEKYKNEAKEHRDNAQYYAEQNSDVTFEYIDSVKESLENQIATKQDNGDYALKSELPTRVSDLTNDLEYTTFNAVIPSQVGNENKVLCTDGENLYWNTNSSYKLFDTKIFDYILNQEQSIGWALQGTYVYKNAVAGSRYGYADFYNKCLEEFQNSQVTANIPNVNITGTLKCVNGILSGFNASARADVPTEFDPSSYSWEMVFKVKTGSDITTNNDIASGYDYAFVIRINSGKLRLYLSTDGTSWNLASAISGTYALSTNTEYYVKLEFTGTNYILSISTNGIEYTQDINVAGTGLITPRIMTIGCRATTSGTSVPFLGSIDLNESYININGERWWNGGLAYKNPNGHLFYDITQKDIVDDLFEQTGMAWFYGIDTKNERIFLPRNNYFVQATADVSEVGKSVEAGLPNITGYSRFNNGDTPCYIGAANTTGAFYENSKQSLDVPQSTGTNRNVAPLGFDASLSNPIYGNSDTVQPNAVKKLLYICVGNTETQSAVTDVVDITTTENDTIPLGYSTYQNGTQPSISWLKSRGQWNDGNVYTTFYNEFVQKIGQNFASGKVVEVTDAYTDYDLVINQDDMTFRLPLLDGSEDLVNWNNRTDLTYNSSLNFTAPVNGMIFFRVQNGSCNLYDNNGNLIEPEYWYSNSWSTTINPIFKGQVCKFGTSPGDIAYSQIFFLPFMGNGSLYFKVANAVQNLELLNAGEVLEAVSQVKADKLDKSAVKAYITETYVNGKSWYRIYSDGWCEQGGKYHSSSNDGHRAVTINLLKPFANTNYNIQIMSEFNQQTSDGTHYYYDVTNNSFAARVCGYGYSWQAFGYIA